MVMMMMSIIVVIIAPTVPVAAWLSSCTVRSAATATTSFTSSAAARYLQQQPQQPQRSLYSVTPSDSSLSVSESETTIAAATAATTTTTTTLDGRKIQGDLTPLNNFILVRAAKAIEETTGGILLTGKAKQVKSEGVVVAVGPGKTHPDSGILIPMPVVPGNHVVYGKYDGTELDISGTKHTLIRDDDILIIYTSDTLENLDTVQVVRDRVLVHVERKDGTSATEGGILIAASTSQSAKPSTGQVVKMGPGKVMANGQVMNPMVDGGNGDDDRFVLQLDDYVKFRDYAGNEVEIAGEEYTVVQMADILAKF
jgi:chaperonin GroES